MKIEDLSVKHNYHCSSESDEVNYYSFDNFLNEYKNVDIDMNLLFRFDLHCADDDYVSLHNLDTKHYLSLFFVLQRKGKILPVTIFNIKEEDTSKIHDYLLPLKEHLIKLWKPL